MAVLPFGELDNIGLRGEPDGVEVGTFIDISFPVLVRFFDTRQGGLVGTNFAEPTFLERSLHFPKNCTPILNEPIGEPCDRSEDSFRTWGEVWSTEPVTGETVVVYVD